MRIAGIAAALALAATVGLGTTAHAQTITKGAGKVSLSIIKWPVNDVNAKAAGSLASKPLLSVAGKPPTGGTITSIKLAKDVGDPLKPGFGPGEYVLDLETSASGPEGNSDASSQVVVFVTLTIDANGKCTVHAADSVNGEGTNDNCDGMCAEDAVGKCSFTLYQAAGNPNYLLGPGAGQPTAGRFRIRSNADPDHCHTGDILLVGSPVPASSNCRAGVVLGVMGVANATQKP